MTRSRFAQAISRIVGRLVGPPEAARRDDTQRAGDPASTDRVQASRRAEGNTAWTRIGGGGV